MARIADAESGIPLAGQDLHGAPVFLPMGAEEHGRNFPDDALPHGRQLFLIFFGFRQLIRGQHQLKPRRLRMIQLQEIIDIPAPDGQPRFMVRRPPRPAGKKVGQGLPAALFTFFPQSAGLGHGQGKFMQFRQTGLQAQGKGGFAAHLENRVADPTGALAGISDQRKISGLDRLHLFLTDKNLPHGKSRACLVVLRLNAQPVAHMQPVIDLETDHAGPQRNDIA